ncbi:hypothetical protein QQF64_010780 [Cirrhinus molitorella]|uniref:Uncharacterized protein n=1 Tax=Cirrhinus molitorella TaxID=172907 RepID=A0ABR3LZS9_9TELE
MSSGGFRFRVALDLKRKRACVRIPTRVRSCCVLLSAAIGSQRRRSPNAVATEIFEPHLGSHILQVDSRFTGIAITLLWLFGEIRWQLCAGVFEFSCHRVAGVFRPQVEREHMWQVEQILSVNGKRVTTGHDPPSRPPRWARGPGVFATGR